MIKKIKTCRYFDLYKINENIYGAIKNNDICMSNAGFIDLGDKVVVFDTFISIDAAKKLKEMAIEITGNENFIIVNSHFHLDHYLGNCVFSDETKIITSEIAFNKMIKQSDELKFGKNLYSEEIKNLKDKLNTREDKDEILDIENNLIILDNLSNDEGKIINPNITFNDKLYIKGLKGNLNLEVIDIAHSPGDLIGTIDDVAFMGDVLVVDEHVYLGTGDPLKFRDELELLLDRDIKYFIPGHGPIGGKENIIKLIEYIDSIILLVKENINDTDKLQYTDLHHKFHNYKGPCFRWNINFLKEFLQEK